MAYETGAPPPPDLPDPITVTYHVEDQPDQIQDAPRVPAARPARGFDATTQINGIMGPPPGTRTYRLRGIETTEAD
ncbi:MAG TPA: hypothetical protein VGP36_00385 [Mycobacteriales bacterium]|jgi:hypothetical protein|nr:hypothetical protein [Mycobacteriales bacterium]